MHKVKNFLSRLPKSSKIGLLGVIICISCVFIVNLSVAAFTVVYLLGVFIIFISAFIGNNSIGVMLTRIGFAMIMFIMFSRLGISENFLLLIIPFAGSLLMLIGLTWQIVKKERR